MKLIVFSVYDAAIENYLNPFVMRARGEALRSWEDLVNDPQTQFNKHPQHFDLRELGTFDLDSGRFESLVEPISLSRGSDLVKKS